MPPPQQDAEIEPNQSDESNEAPAVCTDENPSPRPGRFADLVRASLDAAEAIERGGSGEAAGATPSERQTATPDRRAEDPADLNHSCAGSSRFIAFFDECGDHSLEKIDPDFPLFVLALVVVERRAYSAQIVPALTSLKMRYWQHEGVNFHSRDIRKALGPFSLLQDAAVRAAFLPELTGFMEHADFNLFVSAVDKRRHLSLHGEAAGSPYDIALEFTMEALAGFLEQHGETALPVTAEARGRLEDNELEKAFYRILAHGTRRVAGDVFHQFHFPLLFEPKFKNIAGTQLADLCAHPCARHLLNPAAANRAFDVVKPKIFQSPPGPAWSLYP